MGSAGTFDDLLAAMRTAAAALRDAEVPFALAGGLAVWARGGPETEHDVDFVIRPDDSKRARAVLASAGFRCEQPPEGWLFKVFDSNDAMIDLIFAPNHEGQDVVDGYLTRADEIEVYAIRMPVMSVTDVLATKLLALRQHEVDYDSVLEAARSCREQVDWEALRERTAASPYAKAFFTLADELGLSTAPA